MVRVIIREAKGSETAIEAAEGESLMQAALNKGIDGILADCGGALSCATCHVHVAREWLERVGRPGSEEEAMLEMAIDPDDTSRLSCQIRLKDALDGLVVILPPSQL